MKGIAMGIANVIPGVSGGTVAFITGIYERLIDGIKSFDLAALNLARQFKVKEFIAHTDLRFLLTLLAGIAISTIALAFVMENLFENYPIWVSAFFFGLIIASVYYVGKQIDPIDIKSILMMVIGASIAVGIALMSPASENSSFIYIFICGIVAISSMVLPGLSGSFVLLLMGNYLLVLGAIKTLNLSVIVPFALGCIVGLLGFAHVLSWIFKHKRNETIGILTGFVAGSLLTIWPWKEALYLLDATGAPVLRSEGEKILTGYDWFLPQSLGYETWVAFGLIIIGILSITLLEKMAPTES